MPKGTSAEEAQAAMDASAGKPWAQVFYHNSNTTDMGKNMARGFAVDFLAILLLSNFFINFRSAFFINLF